MWISKLTTIIHTYIKTLDVGIVIRVIKIKEFVSNSLNSLLIEF